MEVDPPVGSRPSGAKAWLLQNCTIIFVSAVVNFNGLVMCYHELQRDRYFFCDDGMWIIPDMLCMKFPL